MHKCILQALTKSPNKKLRLYDFDRIENDEQIRYDINRSPLVVSILYSIHSRQSESSLNQSTKALAAIIKTLPRSRSIKIHVMLIFKINSYVQERWRRHYRSRTYEYFSHRIAHARLQIDRSGTIQQVVFSTKVTCISLKLEF